MFLVPFATLPRVEWHPGMEKRERLDPNTFEDDVDFPDDELASLSSEESDESFIEIGDYITSLIPVTPPGGVKAKAVWEEEEEIIVKAFKPGCIRMLWRKFQAWRKKERERRIHYIYKEYEERVKQYDEKIKNDILDEMQANEEALVQEVLLSEKRMKANSFRKANKLKTTQDFDNEVKLRDKEAQKMEFYCLNLQRWATEKHDLKLAILEDHEARKEYWYRVETEEKHQEELVVKKIADGKVLEKDNEVTQEALTVMRQTGKIAGTNTDKKEKKKKKKKRKDDTTIHLGLADDNDFVSKRKGMTKKLIGRDYISPFTEDMQSDEARKCLELKCHRIGERGALCLGAEFVRGASPNLQILDLSFCEIQTRGMGRLLHGVRIANLFDIRKFIFRGNHITSRALEYLKELLISGILVNLQVIDLRDNELGDEGCDIIMRIIIAGYLNNTRELYLQNNGISDKGFRKIVKVMQTMQNAKMPDIKHLGIYILLNSLIITSSSPFNYYYYYYYYKLGISQNQISSEVKNELIPIPTYFDI
jgi:hypothetical protein